MENRIFLTCYERGVPRAVPDGEGGWSVEQKLQELAVTCLAADPADPNRVYAGTRARGVWRTEDMGETWSPLGMEGQIVKSLAVSPHDPNLLYAGSKPALLFSSRDGGTSWAELEGFRRIPNRWWWFSPADPPDRRPYVIAIAPSPTEPDVLLAGVEFGAVVRSEDGGQTWSRHRPGALRDCHSLTFHATHPDWAYEAGGTGGGAAVSEDGGRTWRKTRKGLAKRYGISCAADPDDPTTWYVCVAPSPFNAFGKDPKIFLYRRESGERWRPIGWGPHPLSEAPTALVTDPDHPGHLYAGLPGGRVWHTADYGESWAQLPFDLGGIWFSLLVLKGAG